MVGLPWPFAQYLHQIVFVFKDILVKKPILILNLTILPIFYSCSLDNQPKTFIVFKGFCVLFKGTEIDLKLIFNTHQKLVLNRIINEVTKTEKKGTIFSNAKLSALRAILLTIRLFLADVDFVNKFSESQFISCSVVQFCSQLSFFFKRSIIRRLLYPRVWVFRFLFNFFFCGFFHCYTWK